MKKLAILFLLTIVLASFTFAQVTVTGGLDFNNMAEGNDGERDIQLYTEFAGTAKTELGPGSIGAALQLGTALSFQDGEPSPNSAPFSAYTTHGDIFLKGFYELPAGPGTLGFGISTWPDFGSLHFNVGYTGLVAGPATLGFDVEYDFNTQGSDDKGKKAVFGDELPVPDELILKVTADFAFGLSLVYKFDYVLADVDGPPEVKNYIKEIAYLDVSYTLPSIPLKIGAELSGTGGLYFDGGDQEQAFFGSGYAGDGPITSLNDWLGTPGLTLKPYVEYTISEKVTAGAFFKVQKLGTDKEKNGIACDAWDVEFSPGVWISYAF
jgi:hypothetical protein